jgi:hypothetical protein
VPLIFVDTLGPADDELPIINFCPLRRFEVIGMNTVMASPLSPRVVPAPSVRDFMPLVSFADLQPPSAALRRAAEPPRHPAQDLQKGTACLPQKAGPPALHSPFFIGAVALGRISGESLAFPVCGFSLIRRENR